MPTKRETLGFPEYGECEAKGLLDNLLRLTNESLFDTEYINARAAAAMAAHFLKAYTSSLSSGRWNASASLKTIADPELRFRIVCAALFDLICNAEYIHGRVTNSRWIYCNRHHESLDKRGPIHAYYSFLKQCPHCSQDRGLESRLSGAQHKPSSHHIGEITTVATVLVLKLLAAAATQPLRVSTIAKQSHDVDALAWRDNLLVLFEIKASPLVSYPLRVELASPFMEDGPEGPVEVNQHRLIDVEYQQHEVSLFLANQGRDVPLGRPDGDLWPYPQLGAYVSTEDGFLDYLEAWAEVFGGYRIPKTLRKGRDVALGYLANGWGDEIDSNKTKAGLGRTDDIKRGRISY